MGLPVNDKNALFQAQQSGGAAWPASAFSTSINIAPHTEDIASWSYYSGANSATKSGTTKTAIDGDRLINLSEVNFAGVYGLLNCNWSGAGYTPFIAGKPYLVSLYVWCATDFWWHHRSIPGTPGYGQGAVLCRGNELTRVWLVAWGNSTTTLDKGSNPTAAPGAQNDGNTILAVNNNYGGTMAAGSGVYIGGLNITALPTGYADGIAMIGDSRRAGSSGWSTGGAVADRLYDMNTVNNREVSTVLGSILRAPVFNRAIGGQRLDEMDARWATDITPLKSRCYAAHIQGGTNDISQSRTLAQMQASVQSMTTKAQADGFRKIYYETVEPFAAASADPAKESLRQSFNSWLLSTYGSACADTATFLTDTGTGKDLVGAAYGDGTHYPGGAKTAVAAFLANTLDYSWRITPAAYSRAVA